MKETKINDNMGVSDEGFVPRSIHPCIHYVHLIDSDMKCLH
jgi:hypothetical protein